MTGHPGRGATVLVVLAVAELVLTVDMSISNVAVPAIRTGLGFSPSGLEWVVNGYALTFGGLLLLGGRAADVLGGRRVFVAALGVFTVASLTCALASSPAMLVAARLVQGVGAGVLSPTTLSILTATYAEGERRNRALSIWTGVAIGGGAVGAVLGGVLVSALSWRWIFFVNVPTGVLLAAAATRLPAGGRDTRREGLDVGGAVTVTAGLTALVWALSAVQTSGWASATVLLALTVAVVLLVAFLLVERRAGAPLVPFDAFRSRRLTAGNLLSFLSFFPVLAIWYFLTLYLQAGRGFSAMQAGLLFVPLTAAVACGSQLSFRLVGRTGARVLLAVGGVVAAIGAGWLGRSTPHGALVSTVVVPAVLVMLGGGLMFGPVTVAATSGVPAERSGLASGLLNTTRQIGGAVGLAGLATVAAADGYAAAFRVAASVFVGTAVLGALLLPRRTGPSPRVSAQGDGSAWRGGAVSRRRPRRRSAVR